MAELREVSIPVGRRTYLIQTELDDDEIKRVLAILNEVCEAIGGGIDQNNLLMLTCLQLAYDLEKISKLLESLNGRLNELKP